MSQFAEIKKHFLREFVAMGSASLQDFQELSVTGREVPEKRLAKWTTKLLSPCGEFTGDKRLVNRYKLGADPEFIFQNLVDGTRIDAHHFGLKQGPAFGEDNNGRLTEIRPHPSRSALDVVASILTTFRWLALLVPKCQQAAWIAGGYQHRDGLGGHVHFGRKRPTRTQEVSALDNINRLLLSAGIYPLDEQQMRVRGDARGQRYGQDGDFRLQNHGYEYRTFISWLDSPEIAFLSVVLAKLAVFDPGLAVGLGNARSAQALTNFLAYFKDVDDDARLAHIVLSRGGKRHLGGDFRARWGLPMPEVDLIQPIKAGVKVEYLPSSIPPDDLAKKEIIQHLLEGKALTFREPKPTWSPLVPPNGYECVLPRTETLLQKGLGEMVNDLVVSKGHSLRFINAPYKSVLFPDDLLKKMSNEERGRINFPHGAAGDNVHVIIPQCMREGQMGVQVKRFLVSGALPIWRIKDVRPASYGVWELGHRERKPKFRSRVIEEVKG